MCKIYIYINIYIYIYKDGCRSKERIRIYFKIRRSTKRFLFFKFIYFVLTYMLYVYVCFQLVAFIGEHMWHKALLMGYSMRLELTLVSSLNDLWLVRWVYIGLLFLLPGVCLLWSALPIILAWWIRILTMIYLLWQHIYRLILLSNCLINWDKNWQPKGMDVF